MLASIQYPLQRNHMAMNYGNEVACVWLQKLVKL